MAQLGLDYSDARPGGAALKAAGVAAVGRYLASDSRGITAAEYADLKANGIGVWLVFESQTSDLSVSMLNGFAKGVADAQRALAQIAAQGIPDNLPVSWAADFDIAPGSDRVAPAEAYVDGWNTVIPAGRRMGYGGLWFINYIHSRGKVDFLWECASHSFRHGVDPATVPLALQQTTDNPPIAGTDYNLIFDTSSFAGATQGDDELSAADVKAITDFVDQRIGASESRNRRETRARVYQRHELPNAPLWIAGPTFVPRALQPNTPERYDQACLQGDTLLVDPGDFARPQPISEVAWKLLIEEHDNFRNAIADAVVAKLKS